MKLLGSVLRLGLSLVLVDAAAGFAADHTVTLRALAVARSQTVTLSDLLPADAPADLFKASTEIELCPAPQVGVSRRLSSEEINNRLRGYPELVSQFRVPPTITLRRAAWPIREGAVRGAIAQFLRGRGMKIVLPQNAEFHWPDEILAADEDPTLQVASWGWNFVADMPEANLRCTNRFACGSFLVRISLPGVTADRWRQLAAGQPSPQIEKGRAASQQLTVLAQRGKPATLILDDGLMTLSMPVICLEKGVLQQQIKVFDAERRRVIRAAVIGENLLRSSL